MEFSIILAGFHPKLVHLPIALLLTALLFDLAGLWFRSERAAWVGKILVAPVIVTLLAAFVCGICAEIWSGRAGVPHQQIKWHELAANAAAWLFLGLSVWRIFLKKEQRTAIGIYIAAGALALAILLGTAHLGGDLVYEYGAAVRGARATTILSTHDLNTLAQRQTDLNLRYSDWMHHIFGWIVLVLGLTLLIGVTLPKKAHQLRWVGPILLLAGGAFLFVFADLDLYRWNDLRQFYDREVQAHKLLALLLMGFGARGLWVNWKKLAPKDPTKTATHFQNQLVATMALIGGGLLFTHVHTVAPYANVAAGVYANHIALGLVALVIGAIKLFDNLFPRRKNAWAIAFPLLVLFEAFLLITYTEGIPWWLGYGHYNRWGAHGGNIAPYGDFRAELSFDPESTQVNVYVMDRFTDAAIPVPARHLTLGVAQGYLASQIPLQAVDGDAASGAASHFRGEAPFLHNAPMFDAWLDLPKSGRLKRGYFDPWVTPAITGLPPNELARFVCPMHEGILAKEGGTCPICKMDLVPLAPLANFIMHDPRLEITFDTVPQTLHAGEATTLRFAARRKDSGEILKDLLIVHEHPLHLIVVSEDLRFFDHVHPNLRADGSLNLRYTFPAGGNFLLFADLTPRGERSQAFRIPVHVEGTPQPAQGLELPTANGRQIDSYHVEFLTQPRQIIAKRETYLGFRLMQDGKPVTDLEPYLASMGHCVAISQGGEIFLHSHPLELKKTSPTDRGGPEVFFHTQFPKPGLYKVWGQFQRGGKIVVADFVVRVDAPLLSPGLVSFLLFD